MTSARWDVIVVGAGLGGMLAAAILARRGRRVLLLEREADVGGRLRSFEVDGFVVDAGAYLWPNAHLGTALQAAGAAGFVAAQVPPNEVLRIFVQGHAGRRFSFPWPGRPESAPMLASAETALRADADTYRKLSQLWNELAALPDETVDGLLHTPVRDALPRFTGDPAVAAAFRRNVMLFGTHDPYSASMGECIRLRRRRTGFPAPVPECAGANPAGGIRALPLALRAALNAHAVDLRLHHHVDHIMIDGGRVGGVRAHSDGHSPCTFAASTVVCNVPIWALLEIAPAEHFPQAFRDNARRFGPVGGVVAAAFAFDGLPRLRHTGEPDHFRGWTRLLIGPDAEFGGGTLWTTHHSPYNAPPGRHILQAMRLSPHGDIADARRVGTIHTAFEAMLDEVYFDARDRLLWKRSWVSRDGSEYLITATPRPPVRVPDIDGLYLVGESTDVPAVQMDAAALSALRCVELIGPPGRP